MKRTFTSNNNDNNGFVYGEVTRTIGYKAVSTVKIVVVNVVLFAAGLAVVYYIISNLL